jgi:hypothetical protein
MGAGWQRKARQENMRPVLTSLEDLARAVFFRAGAGLAAIVQAEIDLYGRRPINAETGRARVLFDLRGQHGACHPPIRTCCKHPDPHRRGRKIREAFIADEGKVLVALVIPRLSCGF